MTDDEAIIRGQRAEALLNDPLIVETFAALEADYIQKWRRMIDPAGRELVWMALQNLEEFKSAFSRYIRGGQAAVAAVERKAAAKKQDAEP